MIEKRLFNKAGLNKPNLLKTCQYEIQLAVMHIFLGFQYKLPFQQKIIKPSITEWLLTKEHKWSTAQYQTNLMNKMPQQSIQDEKYCGEHSHHSHMYNEPHVAYC